MEIEQLIIQEAQRLPDSMKQELLHFAQFLTSKVSVEESEVIRSKRREFGFVKGKYIMSPDFNNPLEDFNDYMQ